MVFLTVLHWLSVLFFVGMFAAIVFVFETADSYILEFSFGLAVMGIIPWMLVVIMRYATLGQLLIFPWTKPSPQK
ncbi:MAG: hypothetical protein CMQ15_04515 [Gammaproteobacteria bacterium]|mgnify:CR=1 FL=1|nr:hypothetical protein [Gammaproteobacteria bacterium]|tara:strand:+ start:1335 stop:1559 length:225 start_codon:yes stop_codon:yes gene_type:complete